MAHSLFKFSTAEGAASILKNNSIFITSPLDLNDPFEMRPGWTQSHQKSQEEDEAVRNQVVANLPVFVATKEGLQPLASSLGKLPVSKPMDVTQQRGISDGYNEQVFAGLHGNFRVLSFVKNIPLEGEADDLRTSDTLLWAHYADQFQGVCLVIDPEKFVNGIQQAGFPVQYLPERRALLPEDYNLWKKLVSAGTIQWTSDAATGALKQRYLDLLLYKSPAWSYEQEVRMIYDYPIIREGSDYRRISIPCPDCKRANIPLEKCGLPNYRDAIHLPPEAIQGVIFGADCATHHGMHVMAVLDSPRYAHVKTYWSCLASHVYGVQYLELPKDTIKVYQQEHTRRVSSAKHHIWWDADGGSKCNTHAATKSVNYVPQPKGGS